MDDTAEVSTVIDAFLGARRFEEIEKLADRLGEIADLRSADALVYRLGDDAVQGDPDVEDAVCSALVRLGIMRQLGNLNFRFLSRHSIPVEVQNLAYERYRSLLPAKYFER